MLVMSVGNMYHKLGPYILLIVVSWYAC